MGPTKTIGATNPPRHNLAVKVVVFQRPCGTASFAMRRPATQAGHLGGSPDFIDEDKSPRVEVELPSEPGLARDPHTVALLFARMRNRKS